MGDDRPDELPPQVPTYKVIVVGDSGVGKTCLTCRFCNGCFPSADTEATIGVDFREKTIKDTLDGKTGESIKLHLWDTAGQERFRKSMVAHYYRNVSAVVLVYDVMNETSFNSLSKWVAECNNHGLTPEDVPMIVVGNKLDSGNDARMEVSTYKAQRFADMHKMPLFETSAKDDDKAYHVEAIFVTLAHKIKKRKASATASVNNLRGKTRAIVYDVKDGDEEEGGSSCFGC